MNNKLRFGILGTARIAKSVIPHLQAVADVVAVGSRDGGRAQSFASELKIPQAFGSYEEIVHHPEIDAVYVPLPASLHCEYVLKATAAGKHILCEKPLAVSAEQAEQMIQAARRHQVVLLDGTMWYHTSRAKEMKTLAENGSLGELRQITSAFTFPGNVLAADNVRFSRSLGGGSLLDIGWYCVGASLWMFDAVPERVFAAAQWQHPESIADSVDMHMNGLMWFSGDRVASFESGFTAIRRRWIEIAGSQAALVCDDFTRPWNPEKPRFWIHDANGVSHQQVYEHPAIERCLANAFCKLVSERQIEHSSSKLSLNTQRVCEALDRSARSGVVESFIRSAYANWTAPCWRESSRVTSPSASFGCEFR
ncbi:MAG: Gfo/Idh/MocA family oxidoreductase [Planctomycetaceae bacterium]